MPKDNKDLETQLEGLFDIPDVQVDQKPLDVEVLERTIVGLLENEIEGPGRILAEPMDARLVELEPAMVDIPIAVPGLAEDHVTVGATEDLSSTADFLPWETRLREQRIRVLNVLLGSLAGIGTVIVLLLVVNLIRNPSQWFSSYIPYFAAYVVLVALALARRLDPVIRATGLILLAYGMAVAVLLLEGPLSAGGLYLLVAPLLASMLIGQRYGAIAAIVSSLIYAGFLLADHLGWLHPAIPYRSDVLPSVLGLIATFVLITAGVMYMQRKFNLSLTSALDEAEQKHDELVQSQSLLADRAEELGKANALLHKRTVQLQTAAQVSGAAAFAELDSDELVQRVVELIRERFDLYYVGLYLIDEAGVDVYGEWARLRAGTGEAGRQMLALGYKVSVDTSSTVGWCMVNGEARMALDAGAIHLASSSEHVKAARLLPDTRSEMALPLRSRGRVIGALNLRSVEREAFSEEDVPVLQTLADQIAVAIDNARLFAEAQENLSELERVQRRYVREQWTRFISSYGLPVYERTQPDTKPLSDAPPPGVERVLSGQEMMVKSDAGTGAGDATLVVPIRLRGEILGALGLQETQGERWWTDDEIALIEAVADQMALAIENARLLEETQRRAAQERVLSDITAQVRSSTQVDTILRTAVREIGRALRASEGVIKLGSGNDSDPRGNNEGVLEDDSADV
jgi:GAF domain-containing protein